MKLIVNLKTKDDILMNFSTFTNGYIEINWIVLINLIIHREINLNDKLL